MGTSRTIFRTPLVLVALVGVVLLALGPGMPAEAQTGTPAAPSNLRQTGATDSSITIAWNDNSANELSFQVAYSRAGSGVWGTQTLAANVTSWTHSGLTPGSRYSYYVRACNYSGCSAWSNGITATAGALPAAPSNLRVASTTETSIMIAWNDNSTNETSFQVAYTLTSVISWQYATVGANVTSWTHADATREGYYYYVRACNAAGCSAWSNGIEATTQRYRIKLTWGATPADLDSHLWVPSSVSCGAAYHVYYASEGSTTACPFAALDVDDVDGTGPETIAITRVHPGTYRYAVHNYTAWSDEAGASLADSGATVQVFEGTALKQTFTLPAQGSGLCWTVFTLTSDGTNVTIQPVNSFTNDDPHTCGQPPVVISSTATTTAGAGAAGVEGGAERGRSAPAPAKPRGSGSNAAPAASPGSRPAPPVDAPVPGQGRPAADRVPPPPAGVPAPQAGR